MSYTRHLYKAGTERGQASKAALTSVISHFPWGYKHQLLLTIHSQHTNVKVSFLTKKKVWFRGCGSLGVEAQGGKGEVRPRNSSFQPLRPERPCVCLNSAILHLSFFFHTKYPQQPKMCPACT